MDSPPPLPSARAFVTQLLQSLPDLAAAEDSRRATQLLSAQQKDILLALHALLPHHMLDALDLLDRGLVFRLSLEPDAPIQAASRVERRRRAEYFVQSTRTLPTHWKPAGAQSRTANDGYHVRLAAWHCSCPGFAYAAFASPLTLDGGNEQQVETGTDTAQQQPSQHHDTGPGGTWFGGFASQLLPGNDPDHMPPVCKHLLACALAEAGNGMFDQRDESQGRGVRERVVNEAELAGWAAGGGFG